MSKTKKAEFVGEVEKFYKNEAQIPPRMEIRKVANGFMVLPSDYDDPDLSVIRVFNNFSDMSKWLEQGFNPPTPSI